MAIKDRIKQIIEIEDMTHSDFAKALGVQRSNISHLLAGRNKPSVDFCQKLLKRFKNINADWLLLGEGSMFKNPPNSLFDNNETSEQKEEKVEENEVEESNTSSQNDKKEVEKTNLPNKETTENQPKQISAQFVSPNQILVLYDDSTFMTYTKRD